MGKACSEYRKLAESKNLCFEYSVPKMVGMTAEECVLLAIAMDLEFGKTESPLLSDGIIEIGIQVYFNGMMDILRILVVTAEERNNAQLLTMV